MAKGTANAKRRGFSSSFSAYIAWLIERDAEGDVSREKLVAESEPRYRLPAPKKIYAIIITDAVGRTLEINPEFTKMCGYTINELRGKKPGHVLQGPKSETEAIQELHNAIREQRSCDVIITNYDARQRPYRAHIVMEPIRERGKLTGFRAVEEKVS